MTRFHDGFDSFKDYLRCRNEEDRGLLDQYTELTSRYDSEDLTTFERAHVHGAVADEGGIGHLRIRIAQLKAVIREREFIIDHVEVDGSCGKSTKYE